MAGRRAVLFQTDPPYLVGYDGTNHPQSFTGGSNKDWSETYGRTWDDADANSDLYERFITTAVEHAIADDAAWYCWHASRRQAMLEAAWIKAGAFVHCQIIWAKNRPVLTRTWYMWQHEPCLFGWVKKPRRVDRQCLSTVWHMDTIPNGEERPDHPTPKPVEIFAIPMRQHTAPGDVCYEPFSGSGTQIIAAEQLGRRCYALEIEPRYVDVTVMRWQQMTGKAARLDGSEITFDEAAACRTDRSAGASIKGAQPWCEPGPTAPGISSRTAARPGARPRRRRASEATERAGNDCASSSSTATPSAGSVVARPPQPSTTSSPNPEAGPTKRPTSRASAAPATIARPRKTASVADDQSPVPARKSRVAAAAAKATSAKAS